MNRLEFLHSSQKKILAINGSHRIGNTQFALTKIINELEKTHSNTHGILINLHEQKINYATWADYGHGYLP
jgi:multimeric flavodoxin WrbA